jgi:hypothetical protein
MNTIIVSSKGRVRPLPKQLSGLARASLKLKVIPILAPDQVDTRLAICRVCDAPGRFDDRGNLVGCTACGCGVQISHASKQWPRYDGQWCPRDRWPKLEINASNDGLKLET